jgi:hypothetical protein
MSTLTPEQQATVNAMLKKFAERLLPAKLKNTNRNGLLLADYNVARGLPINENTLYDAAKSIYATLDWDIKPAKLVAEERLSKIEIIPVAPRLDDDFEARVRAAEKKDADAKEHAALVAQCKQIIEGYNPTTRRGYDARERDEMQAHWTKELNKAKGESVEYMRQFTKGLAAARDKRYADREKAAERM